MWSSCTTLSRHIAGQPYALPNGMTRTQLWSAGNWGTREESAPRTGKWREYMGREGEGRGGGR